jgi:hypothetical protein
MAMKLRTKEKKNRTALYMSIFIIVVMVASSFAIFLSNPNQNTDYTYGQYQFKLQTSPDDPHKYTLKLNSKTYGFYFLPTDLLDIPVNQSAAELLRSADYIIVTFQPSNNSDDMVISDVVRFDLAQYFQKPYAQGVAEENTTYNFPVITCANATATGPVVYFAMTETTSSIELKDNCVILHGKGLALLRTGTKLMYEYLGVR